jgi:hypothetical protein
MRSMLQRSNTSPVLILKRGNCRQTSDLQKPPLSYAQYIANMYALEGRDCNVIVTFEKIYLNRPSTLRSHLQDLNRTIKSLVGSTTRIIVEDLFVNSTFGGAILSKSGAIARETYRKISGHKTLNKSNATTTIILSQIFENENGVDEAFISTGNIRSFWMPKDLDDSFFQARLHPLRQEDRATVTMAAHVNLVSLLVSLKSIDHLHLTSRRKDEMVRIRHASKLVLRTVSSIFTLYDLVLREAGSFNNDTMGIIELAILINRVEDILQAKPDQEKVTEAIRISLYPFQEYWYRLERKQSKISKASATNETTVARRLMEIERSEVPGRSAIATKYAKRRQQQHVRAGATKSFGQHAFELTEPSRLAIDNYPNPLFSTRTALDSTLTKFLQVGETFLSLIITARDENGPNEDGLNLRWAEICRHLVYWAYDNPQLQSSGNQSTGSKNHLSNSARVLKRFRSIVRKVIQNRKKQRN